MGLLTFSEMQSQVRSMLGGRTNQDALIMRGLQIAQHRIARDFNFEELFTEDETTVDDTGDGNELTDSQITMPATMRKLHALVLIDSSNPMKLVGLSRQAWESMIADTTVFERGRPSHFVLDFKTITLWRVPSQEYTIRRLYSSWPTEITLNVGKDAPSTTTALSDLDHKDDLIITYAVVWCYLAINNRERANFFFQVYKDQLEAAGAFDKSQPATSISGMSSVEQSADYSVPTFAGWR